MCSYLITGAGRGLGLALVRQLCLLPPSQVAVVFAATRSEPTADLQALIDGSDGRVVHITLVVTNRQSIEKAVEEVERRLPGAGLDVLINNAGVMPGAFEGIAKMDNLGYALEVNVEAVHDMMAALLPSLKKGRGRQIVNMYVQLTGWAALLLFMTEYDADQRLSGQFRKRRDLPWHRFQRTRSPKLP